MPWEKSFDTNDALDAAMHVFWAKGYEETSMSDLIEAMGINKGSLYNAYGDKKTLFILVLKKYGQERSQAFLDELKQIDDPKTAITNFFDCAIDSAQCDKEQKGCLLVNTSLKLASFDDDIQEIVKQGIEEVETFFQTCLKQMGMSTKEAKDKAKLLMAITVGLKVISRGAFDADSLNAVKRQALQIIS